MLYYTQMKKELNLKKIENIIKDLIIELGDDPNREGLIETPKRVAKMYSEVFEGIRYTNAEIANMFNKCFTAAPSKDLVVLKDIGLFSYCEHHLALIYNLKCAVGYIPNDKVIGLSKIARIADMAAKRLQLQERLTYDIYEILSIVLNTNDIIVVLEGEHSCMTARGIKSNGAKTTTAKISGLFETDNDLRTEFYNLIRN